MAMQPGPIALYSPKAATITRQPASMAIPPIVSARNRFWVMYPRKLLRWASSINFSSYTELMRVHRSRLRASEN
jgi:hypothetical protein